jgi:hypothetical protein
MAETPDKPKGLVGTLRTFLENRGFYLTPSEVDKVEKPFEEILPAESTEFGDSRDLKDVDVVSASHYLSPFGMFQQKTSNQNEMVQQYRNVSQLSYVCDAVDEISNESLVYDDQADKMVYINWNDKQNKVSENMRNRVIQEFDTILELLNFEEDGHDYFRQWYIDGRIIFQIVLNKRKISSGISKIKIMSCMHLSRMFDPNEDRYFWIYDNKQMKDNQGRDIVGKIPDELMVYVPSGIYIKDQEEKLVAVSYLHTALRDINRLDTLEDHLLIYRLVRAPERRVFYIDTGNLPPAKAEEYLKQVIASWRNKKTYDEVLGNVSVRTKTPSMLEDIFLLRRNGQGTAVETLGSGTGLGDLNDLQYFRQRVFNALKVPFSRVNYEDSKAALNRLSPSANEITAEEVKFHKFISRLQAKFGVLFLKLLHRQLIYKNIIKPEEWTILKRRMKIVFRSDAMFSEAKRIKNLKDKFELLGNAEKYEGKYITRRQILEEIMGKSPEEIMELERELEEEKTKYAGEKPAGGEGGGGAGG